MSTDPYMDAPQPIGFEATISAPHMHAMALEQLKVELVPGSRALDVGAFRALGVGYEPCSVVALSVFAFDENVSNY